MRILGYRWDKDLALDEKTPQIQNLGKGDSKGVRFLSIWIYNIT